MVSHYARPAMKINVVSVFVVMLGAAFGLLSCQSTKTSESTDRFAAADTNHDGKLSRDESVAYFVRIIFESRDANHDGKLTWEEWNVPGSGRTKKQFDAADTDKDGTVSMEEAIAYGRKVGLFSKEFREADTNHDGYVTREEAQAYYASKEGPPR